MPNIKPISDLRNYTEVLKEVTNENPVYLTRNGRGEYAIITIDELDKLRLVNRLFSALEKGESSARQSGWIPAKEVESALGL